MKLIVLVKYESTGANLQTLIDQHLFSEENYNTKEVVYLSNYIRKGFVLKSSLHDAPLHKLKCNLGTVSLLRPAPFSFLSPMLRGLL